MKNVFAFLLSLFLFSTADAQLTKEHRGSMQVQEDSMKHHAVRILQGRSPDERLEADSIFTRMLVKALQTPYSFEYPFDSLQTISIQTPSDSTFRIFTWQLVINDNLVRQHGAIQMNTKDGVLRLHPLIDRSPNMDSPEDSVVNNLNWVGALYYKIIETNAAGKNFYTLLGYDEHDIRSSKKLIDVLTFQDGKPVFGGPYFSFHDTIQPKQIARYIMTYKKYAGPRLTFDPELNMIVFEHLISETGEPEKKYTYIPDGDYEGMKWQNGKWVHVSKVFTEVTPEGQEPVPHPILDEKGNVDENKLKRNQ